jgi:protein-tyrosine kinase
MSTIEKAAAKLAALAKVAVNAADAPVAEKKLPDPLHQEPPSVPDPKPAPISKPISLSEPLTAHGAANKKKRDGNYSAPRRWCDINLEHLAAKGFLSPSSGRSQLAQEMRRIKRPLLLNIKKAETNPQPGVPPANLIMITSALPDEGKTFISINLAMSLAAELDRKVLLVDADGAKSDISEQLGIEPIRGLADLLAENNYFAEDAVLTTNMEQLSVLPAGEPSDHTDELYASNLMGEITRGLAAEDPQRIVVFDASPLLATTEAAVLARHMGQVVVVVEANKTPQDAVSQALTQLEGCANVSLVLNKTNRRESGGYNYGYGYGRYERQRAADERASVDSSDSNKEAN